MMKLVDSSRFRDVMAEVLLKKGVNPRISKEISNSLIETSLMGIDSHGIGLFPHYYKEISLGSVNISPNLMFDQRSPSISVLDAQNTLGHYSGVLAMEESIRLAKISGVGVVSVKNSNHFGAAWYFTNLAANQNMIGIAFTNTEPLVNAFNSKDNFFGTNPFCFSSPIKGEDPFCLDMATSVVPWNKIKNYRKKNQKLDLGWAYDKNGNVTTDPHEAFSLSTIGGYKGFGLGMVIEILCSGLSSGPLSKDIPPLYKLDIKEERRISHFFMTLDISRFISIDFFNEYMSKLAFEVRNLTPSGHEDVIIPGDKEKKCRISRLSDGIPISNEEMEEFSQISEDFISSINKSKLR